MIIRKKSKHPYLVHGIIDKEVLCYCCEQKIMTGQKLGVVYDTNDQIIFFVCKECCLSGLEIVPDIEFQ